MKIDRKLNVVFDAPYGNSICYVHSVPVRSEIFHQFFWTIGRVYSRLIEQGINTAVCHKLVYLALEEDAKLRNEWDDNIIPETSETKHGIKSVFVNEIMRLTNVIYPTANGYESKPLEIMFLDQKFDQEDVLERCIFFTITSLLSTRMEYLGFMARFAKIYPLWQLTSLNSTEFQHSLEIPVMVESITNMTT